MENARREDAIEQLERKLKVNYPYVKVTGSVSMYLYRKIFVTAESIW